jgi:hypothetical protein
MNPEAIPLLLSATPLIVLCLVAGRWAIHRIWRRL